MIERAPLFGCDIAGELDHFGRTAFRIQNRIVGRLKPDIAPIFSYALEFTGFDLSAGKVRPEVLVFLGLHMGRICEDAVMLALYLLQRVTDGRKKVFVGGDDCAVELEFNGGLRGVQRGKAAFSFDALFDPFCHIGGKFDHFANFSSLVTNWHIGRFDPDGLAGFRDAGKGLGHGRSRLQGLPEVPILRAFRKRRVDEDLVFLANDLIVLIAHQSTEGVIGIKYLTVRCKPDDCRSMPNRPGKLVVEG